MARIRGQVPEHSKLAFSALSWISNAFRPLQLDELQHALAVRRGDQALDEEALEDETLIISVSAGLITLDAQSRAIRLVHFSVEEYFEKTRSRWFPDADSQIAETCLTYLSFDTFKDGRCSSNRDWKLRLLKNCFLDYAAQNWGYHAHAAEEYTVVEHTLEGVALHFLGDDHKVSYSSQICCMTKLQNIKNYTWSDPYWVSGLHLAAWFGLIRITKRILEGNVVADSKDSMGETPLFYAVQRGHEKIIELLLNRTDVNVNSQDKDGDTPLSLAARRGHEAVVKLLLDRIDVIADSQNQEGDTPLSLAAERGYKAVVKLLLDRNVAADSQNIYGDTPLSLAAQDGYEKVVKLLLDRKDVKADSRDKNGNTPLLMAAAGGYEAVVKLLLGQKDVTADSQNKRGNTPLLRAARNGHEAVVKLLLDRNVTADSQNKDGNTPLSLAAQYGHVKVMNLLKEKLNKTKVEE